MALASWHLALESAQCAGNVSERQRGSCPRVTIATQVCPRKGENLRRRDFIAALGASACSLRALAQASVPVVGFLNSASPVTYRFNADAFREGLAQAGFVEGRNVRIEERWANADYSALPRLAADLVAKGVVAIAATGDVASAEAAKGASATVPIVFTIGGDPVRFGLVESLARPGGNLTGIAFVPNQLGAKRVQLLRDLSPKITRVGLLMNPDNLNAGVELADVKEGASKLGVQLTVQNARNAGEIDAAFAEIARARMDALIAATDPVMLDRRQQIAALAERSSLPAISFTRNFATAGMLMSYGPDIGWMYRQAGGQIARILKGAKPADIPVMQSVRFELVLNMKTARRLGISVPPTFLASVDEVVE
jgi:ABC-type uncharacterized transport system substrate-binding protein